MKEVEVLSNDMSTRTRKVESIGLLGAFVSLFSDLAEIPPR